MANEQSEPRRLPVAARAAALALILLVARLAYLQHPWPVHGDERSFVEAIGFPAQYPVHHPGYPLWIAIGTALHAFGFSPYASYQTWSLLASVALPVLMYIGLGRGLRDGLAWWVALSFGVCPILWFTGTTALNYAAGCTSLDRRLVPSRLSENRIRPLYAAAALPPSDFVSPTSCCRRAR
jgi:hypothetical protein